MIGLSLLAASAIATQAAAAPPAAAPARSLKDIPGVTITYYDVTGKNGQAIAKSIEKNAPRAPGSKEAQAGTTNWTMKAQFTQRTTDGKCSIASAKAVFEGQATLPRLTTEATVNPQLQQQWKTFLTGLENGAAANLGYAYDRTGDVEKAILGASCETVNTVGSEAIAKLRKEAAEYQQAQMAAAKAGNPNSANSADRRQRDDPVKPESY